MEKRGKEGLLHITKEWKVEDVERISSLKFWEGVENNRSLWYLKKGDSDVIASS